MPFLERKAIVENLSFVDLVIDFEDDELGSCNKCINEIKEMYPDDEIIFANGGDRNKENIPEMSVDDVKFEFSVGGDDKKNSSSWILKNWQYYHEERLWGLFIIFLKRNKLKLKSLLLLLEKE